MRLLFINGNNMYSTGMYVLHAWFHEAACDEHFKKPSASIRSVVKTFSIFYSIPTEYDEVLQEPATGRRYLRSRMGPLLAEL